mmetsp:Transcript_17210/g.52020  ORF Transcript_17210/g.52020 Transcript_17210/m.52020 type:complete len:213 (+) Transcript_17210:3293-3931(+)
MRRAWRVSRAFMVSSQVSPMPSAMADAALGAVPRAVQHSVPPLAAAFATCVGWPNTKPPETAAANAGFTAAPKSTVAAKVAPEGPPATRHEICDSNPGGGGRRFSVACPGRPSCAGCEGMSTEVDSDEALVKAGVGVQPPPPAGHGSGAPLSPSGALPSREASPGSGCSVEDTDASRSAAHASRSRASGSASRGSGGAGASRGVASTPASAI